MLHWFETLHSECDKLGWWVSSQHQISETIGSEIRKSWRERQSRSRGQQEEIPSGAAVKELIPRNPDYLLTYRPTISRDGLASVKLGKVLYVKSVHISKIQQIAWQLVKWYYQIVRWWCAAMFDDRYKRFAPTFTPPLKWRNCNVQKFIKCAAMHPRHVKERKGFASATSTLWKHHGIFVNVQWQQYYLWRRAWNGSEILPEPYLISFWLGVESTLLIALYKKTDRLSMTTCHDIWSRKVSDWWLMNVKYGLMKYKEYW